MPRSWLQRRREAEADAKAAGKDGEGALMTGRDQTEGERQLHGLTVLSLFLHSSAAVEEMVSRLMEQGPSVTGAVFIYPLLLERKRQVLRASILEGCTDPRLEAAMEAFQEDLTALEFSLVQNHDIYQILEEGEVALRDSFGVLLGSVLPEEQWRPGEEKLGVRRLAIVPMVVENEPLGLVVFAFDRDEIDIESLELLVGHLTLALRDLVLRDEAVRFSDVDAVTWVYNRRYLTQSLESEMERAGRYGRALSVVALDVDGFGKFNEAYGQSMGDRLLRMVATTLAESVSPPELVARYKDDEFVVVLPETNRAAAVTTTTRLLASLAHVSAFGGEDGEAEPVTFSVSIACFPEDASAPQALLARALADLETAKQDRAQEQAAKPRRPVDPMARAAGQ